MVKLTIPDVALEKHRNAYSKSIEKALEILSQGGMLKFAIAHGGKGLTFRKPQTTDSINGKTKGVEYVKLVLELHRQYDLMIADVNKLHDCVKRINTFVHEIKGSGSEEERKQLCAGEEAIRVLFDYARFGRGHRLSYKNNVCDATYFQWEKNPNWSAWHFLRSLDVSSCCYCNTDGVFSLLLTNRLPGGRREVGVSGAHKRSPLDHFFQRFKYPYLGLSVYNLIPSCTRCNTNMKGIHEQDINENIHPYLHSFDDGMRFVAVFDDLKALYYLDEDSVSIKLQPHLTKDVSLSQRACNSSQFFHLDEVYNQTYKSETMDVLRRVVSMPDSYWEDMNTRYPMFGKSILNRVFVGASLDRMKINKERFSKLACDLWSQLREEV